MRLVRIGPRVYNMSALVEARIGEAEATLLFAAPEGSYADREATVEPYFIRLYGPEVEAFEKWLGHNCEDITPDAEAWKKLIPAPVVPDDDGHNLLSSLPTF